MSKAEEANEEKVPVNRREFLNLAWLASLGFVLADVAGVTLLFAFPRFREGEFGGVFNAGSVSQLPTPGSAPENNPKGKFWLSRTDEGIRAIYKVCTHLGCLYNWQEQEDKFICPCHGSQFTKEGEYIQGPAPRSLDLFRVRAVNTATNDVVAETEGPGDAVPVIDDPDVVYRVDTGDKINGNPV